MIFQLRSGRTFDTESTKEKYDEIIKELSTKEKLKNINYQAKNMDVLIRVDEIETIRFERGKQKH